MKCWSRKSIIPVFLKACVVKLKFPTLVVSHNCPLSSVAFLSFALGFTRRISIKFISEFPKFHMFLFPVLPTLKIIRYLFSYIVGVSRA